tara:strand:- start:6450 stop:7940 length:1491 start_codon:yes stop_codon:yes gene_type:complete
MNYDLIIIGSGPAGLSTLEHLINTEIKVLVIESGNDIEIKNYNSELSKHYGDFSINFIEERKIAFFGTTALWKEPGVGGTFWEFDSIDFENKLIDSQSRKWGIGYNEIQEAYKEARKYININFNSQNLSHLKRNKEWREIMKNYSIKIASNYYTKGRNYENFIKKKKSQILKSKNISILFNSTLKEIVLNNDKNQVKNITVLDSNNDIVEFYCRELVVSTGCFENSKILLNLNNKYDLGIKDLGKYITFHPSIEIGHIKVEKHSKFTKSFIKDIERVFILRNKNLDLKENFNYGISITPEMDYNFINESILKKLYTIKTLANKKSFIDSAKLLIKFFFSKDSISYVLYKYRNYNNKIRNLKVSIIFEHIAEYDNCIILENQNLKIYTKLSKRNIDLLKKSIIINQNIFKKNFKAYKVHKIDYDNLSFETNNHHHGGTIIKSTNKKGVVNENLRVHDINNLYISGSSIFPNSSIYNPTFTIIAIGLRLSKYLLKKST